MSKKKKSPEPEEKPQADKESAEPEEGKEEKPLPPLDIYALLRYCIGLLHGHAWQSMGLVVDPATNKTSKDLDQARIAIDCVAFMVEQLEAKVDDQERTQLQSLLSDLRVNFVQQSKPSEATEEGKPESEA